MAKGLQWTEKQREIDQHFADGKEFMDIVAMGYSLYMVSKVKKARAEGQKPEAKEKAKVEAKGGNGKRELVGVSAPTSTPIVFRIEKQEIKLDPLELMKQYRYYTEIVKKDGYTESFSEVMTIAIKLLWTSLLDIPITGDLLNAIFYE